MKGSPIVGAHNEAKVERLLLASNIIFLLSLVLGWKQQAIGCGTLIVGFVAWTLFLYNDVDYAFTMTKLVMLPAFAIGVLIWVTRKLRHQ